MTDPVVERFVQFMRDFERPEEVFADDVVVDMNVPEWFWQLQGGEAMAKTLREDAPNGADAETGRVERTSNGWLVELFQRYINHAGDDYYFRQLYLLDLDASGKVDHLNLYCTGGWSMETRERHAKEAQLLGPVNIPR